MLARLPGSLFLVVLACAATCPIAGAAPPWSKLAMFKHLEADPHETYSITEENGPWTIMATSFTGEGAEEQAQQLIYELRKEFKLPAYLYHKKFGYSGTVTGIGLNPRGEPPKMRYSKSQDVVEFAVLVGDFPTVDDAEAQKVLKKIRYARPKSLSRAADKPSAQALADVRSMQRKFKETLPQYKEELKRGPMGSAFVITNPLLPSDYFVPKGIDKFVIEMNKDVPHSLLDCPDRYTVKVATFTGHAILLDKKAEEAIQNGATPKSWLEEAAKNAHLLTEALRQKGYEAYEFHNRTASIVTVGSFKSAGAVGGDGKFVFDRAVLKTMQAFAPETKVEPGKPPQIGKPRKLAGIPFDLQPMPMEVPQHSISSDYSHTVDVRR